MNTQYEFFLLYFGTTPKAALMSDQDFYIYSIFVCFLLYHRTSLLGLTSPKYFSSKYNDNQTFYMSDKIQHMGGLVDLIRQKVCTRLASLKCAITKVFNLIHQSVMLRVKIFAAQSPYWIGGWPFP